MKRLTKVIANKSLNTEEQQRFITPNKLAKVFPYNILSSYLRFKVISLASMYIVVFLETIIATAARVE